MVGSFVGVGGVWADKVCGNGIVTAWVDVWVCRVCGIICSRVGSFSWVGVVFGVIIWFVAKGIAEKGVPEYIFHIFLLCVLQG
jgi:hypothetical protein